MPTYEYKCANGHHFEVFQRMSDEPLARCQECGAAVERVFHPVAVHFKGSGFYTTDYARKRSSSTADGTGESKEKGASEKPSKEKSGSSSKSD